KREAAAKALKRTDERFRRSFTLAWFGARHRMTSLLRYLRQPALAAAAVNLFCGLLIACFSSAHLIAVTVRRIDLKIPAWVSGEPHAMIAGVPYDFRIYSLL